MIKHEVEFYFANFCEPKDQLIRKYVNTSYLAWQFTYTYTVWLGHAQSTFEVCWEGRGGGGGGGGGAPPASLYHIFIGRQLQ